MVGGPTHIRQDGRRADPRDGPRAHAPNTALNQIAEIKPHATREPRGDAAETRVYMQQLNRLRESAHESAQRVLCIYAFHYVESSLFTLSQHSDH